MKKAIYIGLILSIAAGCLFTGCGDKKSGETSEPAVTTEAETEEETEEITEEETEAETEEETEAETEEETEAETEEATEKETEAREPIVSDKLWADFDNMTFYVNGKEYKLGETTLQDMIDDGVPFDEDDLANAGNNVNANYETPSFEIVLGDYYHASVYAMNDTEENMPANECWISTISMYIEQDETQDILSFNFPLNITKEDLIANCGEPEDPDDIYTYDSEDSDYHVDKYTYRKDSEKYYGYSKYEFEFVNGEFDKIYMTYLP